MTTKHLREYVTLALKPDRLELLKSEGYHQCPNPRCPMFIPRWKLRCAVHWKELPKSAQARIRSEGRLRVQAVIDKQHQSDQGQEHE